MNFKLAAIVVFVVITGTWALNPGPAQSPPGLKGHVRDSSNKALQGVVLKLLGDCADPVHDPCTQVVSSTSSAEDGSFSLGVGIKDGAYGLQARKDPLLGILWAPVNIPGDNSKPLDLILPGNRRNETGQLQLSPQQAKEVFASARVDHNYELIFLTSRILEDSASVDSDKQFYEAQAHTARLNLQVRALLEGEISTKVDVSAFTAYIKASNRLTGETFEVAPSTDGTFTIPVTAVGTYDLFVTKKDDKAGWVLVNDLAIDGTKRKYTFLGGNGSVSVTLKPLDPS